MRPLVPGAERGFCEGWFLLVGGWVGDEMSTRLLRSKDLATGLLRLLLLSGFTLQEEMRRKSEEGAPADAGERNKGDETLSESESVRVDGKKNDLKWNQM